MKLSIVMTVFDRHFKMHHLIVAFADDPIAFKGVMTCFYDLPASII